MQPEEQQHDHAGEADRDGGRCRSSRLVRRRAACPASRPRSGPRARAGRRARSSRARSCTNRMAACTAQAKVTPANTARPASHRPCGIHIGVCSGVEARLSNSRLSSSTCQPCHTEIAASAEQQHRGREIEHRDQQRRHAREEEIDARMRLLQQRRGEAERADDRQQIGAELGHALHRMAEQPPRHDVVERGEADRQQRPAAGDLHPAHRRADPARDRIALVVHRRRRERYGIVRLRAFPIVPFQACLQFG